MFHVLISGEWGTDHVASGRKENCPGFPGCLPRAVCCKALTSAAASYRTALCLKKWLLTRLFLLPDMCVVQSNSALQPQTHNASSCKEVLIATPAFADC